jgi:hypothetical protein
MAVPDRLEALLDPNQTEVTGIDFVYVYPGQTTLDVFFLKKPSTVLPQLFNDPNVLPSAITIYSPSGGEWIAKVPVIALSWQNAIDGREVMRLETKGPGDFSWYRLHIEDSKSRIDRHYNDVRFTFKANCPSDLDCAAAQHECAPDPPVDFPVDYTARDFWSFRQALLDFATQRYPAWSDRLVADFGVMAAEVMSALGDEFAYAQDRIARETYLELASQRRSVRRLARLVDYRMSDGLGATTWIDVQVDSNANPGPNTIPAGTSVASPDGKVIFEIGRGLLESFAIPPKGPTNYTVDSTRNSFSPHQWDEHDVCLSAGATELYLEGSQKADIPLDDTPTGKAPGKWMLLKTDPTNPAVPKRAWMVRVIAVEESQDKVFNAPVTRIQWEADQTSPFELDLTVLQIHGNLLPATAGQTTSSRFMIGASDDEVDHPAAIERTGPNGSIAYLFSLPGSDTRPLVWLGGAPEASAPEIGLVEVEQVGGKWEPIANSEWTWTPALLGVTSAEPGDRVFTLDDGTWRRIAGFRRPTDEFIHRDYASNDGKTIRFGDGEFGLTPSTKTIFEATLRLGNGSRDNVATDTLTNIYQSIDPVTLKPVPFDFIASATNPLPALGGADEEPLDRVRQLAPQAFRAVTFRAVRPEDYAEAAERLPWVQKAGAAFRWTGSWLTAFVTPDPKGSFEVTPPQRSELQDQLDRFRQAGRPAYPLDPIYATFDMKITVCVATSAYCGEVKEAVLEALFGRRGVRPRPGFFSPDNFTFGTPLERSQLEAAIQAVPGVKAVEDICIRRRGWFNWRPFQELTYRAAPDELIRVVNDPNFPERGSLTLTMEGGA